MSAATFQFKQLVKKVIFYSVYQDYMVRKEVADLGYVPDRQPERADSGVPTMENPVSQLATSSQINEPVYREWCRLIKDRHRYHRKQWEHVYILQVLKHLGFLKPEMKGLGFGVGQEPIPDYLAKCGVEVLCTDLDVEAASEKGWVETNQHSRSLKDLHIRGLSRWKDFSRLVRFQHSDMNAISEDLRGFDFVWSSCALEHLGNIEKGLEFIRRSLDCVRPGGVVVHTTEFNLSSNDETISEGGTVLFRQKDIERLAEELRQQGHQIELNFKTDDSVLDRHIDMPPYSENVHLRIQLAKYVTTSFGLWIRKAI